MKIKKGIVIQKVGNSYVAVASGSDSGASGKMLKLNESGAFLLRRAIELGADAEMLARTLTEEYDVTYDIAKRDSERFVALILENGLAVSDE